MVGGGSGGHVTPILAVIEELAHLRADLDVRFWCDRAYKARAKSLLKYASVPVKIKTIRAGKFRRYHGVSVIRQLLDIPTLVHNVFDISLVIIGFVQSFIRLLLWRPQVIFLKGGFVCLPVGYAAWLLRIPFVIHDSDAHPGLTNRLLAPHAKAIATGAPLEYYSYPADKAYYVGIPTQADLKPLNSEQKRHTKELLHVPSDLPLIVVTGGGLGAKRINDALIAIAPQLLTQASIIHLSGNYQYKELQKKVPQSENYKLFAFIENVSHMAKIIAAADIVISRAGATTMLELAAVAAPTIIIPNDQLTGGHQTKNAEVYQTAQAALVITEDKLKDNNVLLTTIFELLRSSEKRDGLGKNLYQFAKPLAAQDMARIIQSAGKL